jgi:hypothetical protein
MEAAKAQNWAVEPQEEKRNLAIPAFYKQHPASYFSFGFGRLQSWRSPLCWLEALQGRHV